jgi:hypothetical protein
LLNQSIDVSTGATGAAIASGQATYNLTGFFSTYLTQDDVSTLRVRFLDAGDVELGAAEVGGQAFLATLPVTADKTDWGQDSAAGAVPIGTASVAVEILATSTDENHDGYLDLVGFSISQVPEPTSVVLTGLAFAAGVLMVGRRKAPPID